MAIQTQVLARPRPRVVDAPALVPLPRTWGRQRVSLCGVQIDRVDLNTACERVSGFLTSERCHQIVTVNLDFLKIAQTNPTFRSTINEADMAVADGMPLVWASRLRDRGLDERVTGVELVNETCRLAAEKGQSVFLLGAAPGVAEAAAVTLEERFDGLEVAGAYSPPYGPLDAAEDAKIIRMINHAQPGVLLVALGAPRQDLWIHAHRDELDARVAIGVGCTLDLLAGTKHRAPRWMQDAGLEWAYRMAQEPQRLWRRYLVDDLPMFARLVADSLQPDLAPAISTRS